MRTVSPAPAWAATIQLPDDGRQIGADSIIAGVRDPINPSVEATTHRVEYCLQNMEPIGNRSWCMHAGTFNETSTTITIEKRLGLDQTGMVISYPGATVNVSSLGISSFGFYYVYVKISDFSVSASGTKPDASGYYKSGGGGTAFWYVGSFYALNSSTCINFQYSDRTFCCAYDPLRDPPLAGFTLFQDPGVAYGTWLTNIVPRAPDTARRVWYRFEFENFTGGTEQLLVNFIGTNQGNKIFTAQPGLSTGGTICLVNPSGFSNQFHFFRNSGTNFRGYLEAYEE